VLLGQCRAVWAIEAAQMIMIANTNVAFLEMPDNAFPVFRVSLPQKLNYHKNQAVAIPKVANMSDPR